ncbi:hypothetical protein [Winogradskyella aurantia]|uniref:Lipoprotein n=1 Tax=Winogradskyella aurantia TaxID=1915063 RepID=A0A265UWC0_9FLAO|nr:hypothetical protein [Winogradskyella aurantia]OZV69377.1 hypothetical protein CA834_07960 [Winogradskyella aurantia]
MNKPCKIFGFKLFAVVFLLIAFSCEKDNTDEILTQDKYDTPSVNSAKDFFNQNSLYTNNIGTQARNSIGSLQIDWQNSEAKNYKETPQTVVDILYTPIYLDTDKDAKAFVASTEQSGNVESKIIFVLYKTTNNDNGLSAYVFVYSLDGNLELEYNFENGQSVPFADSSNGLQSRNSTNCDELPNLTVEEIMEWLSYCTTMLDEVVIVAQLNETIDAGPSGGAGMDFSPWVQIDGLGYEGGTSQSGTGGNPQVFVSNTVSATGFSISTALGLPFSSIESQWLTQQAVNNQSLLNAIAEFLNSNKERPIDSAFDNVDPNQLPEIRDEAVDFALDYINHMIDNPNSGFELISNPNMDDTLSFSSFSEAQDFFDNLFGNNYTHISSTFETGSIRRDVHSLEFNSFPQADLVTTIKAMIPDDNNALECLDILNVRTVMEGNNTLFDWTQFGSENPADNDGPYVEINEALDSVKVSIEGQMLVGLNIDGYPVRNRRLITVVITYNYSTAEINNNYCYWYYTNN